METVRIDNNNGITFVFEVQLESDVMCHTGERIIDVIEVWIQNGFIGDTFIMNFDKLEDNEIEEWAVKNEFIESKNDVDEFLDMLIEAHLEEEKKHYEDIGHC